MTVTSCKLYILKWNPFIKTHLSHRDSKKEKAYLRAQFEKVMLSPQNSVMVFWTSSAYRLNSEINNITFVTTRRAMELKLSLSLPTKEYESLRDIAFNNLLYSSWNYLIYSWSQHDQGMRFGQAVFAIKLMLFLLIVQCLVPTLIPWLITVINF